MKHRALFAVVAVALLTVVGGGAVYAQDVSIVNIPFKFTVNKEVLMPGRYEVKVTDEAVVTITPEKGRAVMAAAITRLAQHDPPVKDPMIVFDKVGDNYTLSEIWLPTADGYLLNATKELHQHHVVKADKKKT